MSGKGSSPRPFSVSNQEYAQRWDAIFGKDKAEPKPEQEQHKPEDKISPQEEGTRP